MRLSTSQIFQQSVSAMQNKQAELASTQLKLSTGNKNLAPSDDPIAATRILELDRVIESTAQYQRNSDFAQSRLSLEETALTEVTDLLQHIRELAVRANNAALNVVDRRSIATDVRASLDELIDLANRQDAEGEYLFAGFKTKTQPFADDGSGNIIYAGDQGQRSVQIDTLRQVAVGDSGDDVFMKIDDGAGGVSSIFDIVNTLLAELDTSSFSSATLSGVDSAIETISNTRARIGTRMNTIESQRSANESFSLELQSMRSSLADLDYMTAISQYQQQLLALQASQQSFIKIEGLSLFNYL